MVKVPKLGGRLGVLGAGITALGAAWGYSDARKRGEDPGRAAFGQIGSVVGGTGGLIGGGAVGGAVGGGVGAIPGSVAGAIGGSSLGEKAATRIYDSLIPQELGAAGEGSGAGLVSLAARQTMGRKLKMPDEQPPQLKVAMGQKLKG
jgi:hypothetical protein